MKISKEIEVRFYQNLGRLLFAVAASDKRVHEREYEVFKKVLKKELQKLLVVDNAAFALNQAKVSFDYYNSINADADESFNAFINFKRANEELFTKEVKKLVKGVATKIAAAFSSKNKSELIMLAKLELELKKNFES